MTRGPQAFVALTAIYIRRMTREPMVLRSLLFPGFLTIGTLLATLMTVSIVRAPPVVALPPDYHNPELEASLTGHSVGIVRSDDIMASAESGWARAGTDGDQIYSRGPTIEAALVESVLRKQRGSAWQLDPVIDLPGADFGGRTASRIGRLLGSVFALYGIVLGAGMLARDRDDGTLGVEFTLPIARWIPGAARFAAGSLLLTAFIIPSLLLVDSMFGMIDRVAVATHTIAACNAGLAFGIFGVAQAGARGGFAGPLAAALVGDFALFVLGQFFPSVQEWLPIASINASGSGAVPLLVSIAGGALAVWRFRGMQVG